MLQIQSELHRLYIKNIHKSALDKYDDKSYICDDLITAFPPGIEDVADDIIAQGELTIYEQEKLLEMRNRHIQQ